MSRKIPIQDFKFTLLTLCNQYNEALSLRRYAINDVGFLTIMSLSKSFLEKFELMLVAHKGDSDDISLVKGELDMILKHVGLMAVILTTMRQNKEIMSRQPRVGPSAPAPNPN